MTFLVERLADLRLYLDHLHKLRPRISAAEDLRRDLSLHNDALYALLSVCQLVIDIAGELSARKGLRFDDYTEAVRNLSAYDELPRDLVKELDRLPGFRNVLIREYVALDLERVVQALDRLDPIEQFIDAVGEIEKSSPADSARCDPRACGRRRCQPGGRLRTAMRNRLGAFPVPRILGAAAGR